MSYSFENFGAFSGKGTNSPPPTVPEGTDTPTPDTTGKKVVALDPLTDWCTKNPSYGACAKKCDKEPFHAFCTAVEEQQKRKAAAAQAQAAGASQASDDDDGGEATAPQPRVNVAGPAPFQPAPGDAAVEQRLAKLQEMIEQRRLAREKARRDFQEQQAKTAAYTRNTEQKRPPGAGYATGSEKLMGGQTGYGGYYGGSFGQAMLGAVTELEQAVAEVTQASDAVKAITKDVKTGLVPREDLENAINDLKAKAAKVETIKQDRGLSGLSRLGQEDKTSKWAMLVPLVAVGALAYWLSR